MFRLCCRWWGVASLLAVISMPAARSRPLEGITEPAAFDVPRFPSVDFQRVERCLSEYQTRNFAARQRALCHVRERFSGLRSRVPTLVRNLNRLSVQWQLSRAYVCDRVSSVGGRADGVVCRRIEQDLALRSELSTLLAEVFEQFAVDLTASENVLRADLVAIDETAFKKVSGIHPDSDGAIPSLFLNRIYHHGDTENTEKANEFNTSWSSGSLNLSDGLLNGYDPSVALHGLVLRDLRASVVNLHERSALSHVDELSDGPSLLQPSVAFAGAVADRDLHHAVTRELAANLAAVLATDLAVRVMAQAGISAAGCGGLTASAGAGGGFAGTSVGPVGTAVGVAGGIAVGCIVDSWMSRQFEQEMTERFNCFLDQLEIQMVEGEPVNPKLPSQPHRFEGLRALLDEACKQAARQMHTGVSQHMMTSGICIARN